MTFDLLISNGICLNLVCWTLKTWLTVSWLYWSCHAI